MASLRRSKTLSPDGQTARFLYTIIKQLDLKTIDWNEVASSLDITNGHAARMRFSRFKQHIEGTLTQPRAPRPKKDGEKAAKGKGKGVKRGLNEDDVKAEQVKGEVQENKTGIKEETGDVVKQEKQIFVKKEPDFQESRSDNGEPPVVKVKREPTGDDAQIQSVFPLATLPNPDSSSVGDYGYLTSPAAITPATVSTGSSFAPPAPPPQATVSLADLQLLPKLMPPTSAAAYSGPSYVLQSGPDITSYGGNATIPRIKIEPAMEQRVEWQCTDVVVKNEPINF